MGYFEPKGKGREVLENGVMAGRRRLSDAGFRVYRV